jgi:Rad3-related DNA helicase
MNVTVLTATRDLQQQYEELGAEALWGRAHYKCVNSKVIEKFQKNYYNTTPSAEDCIHGTKTGLNDSNGRPQLYECPHKRNGGCPYFAQRDKTISAKFVVTNYAYWWFSEWWREKRIANRGLFVFDECHRLEDIATNLVTLSVSERRRNEWKLQPFPEKLDGSSQLTIDRTQRWIEGALEDLDMSKQTVKYLVRDGEAVVEMNHKIERLEKTLKYLRDSLKGAESGDFYTTVDEVKGIEVKPTDPTPHIYERFVRPVEEAVCRMLFMSATIGDPETFVRETLKLQSEVSISAIASPHIVSPSDRPVLVVKDAVSMGRSTTSQDEAAQMKMVADVIKEFRKHSDEVVLVLCASWWQTNKLSETLKKQGVRKVVRHPDKMNRVEGVEYMKDKGKGSVLVSPSLWEGFDPHPENSPGMIVIAKVPWPSLGDPVNKLKLRREGGGRWYSGQAGRQMVQGSGRGSRRTGDRCVTVVLDKNAGRVLSTAPPPLWFADAVEKIEWKDVPGRIKEFCDERGE